MPKRELVRRIDLTESAASGSIVSISGGITTAAPPALPPSGGGGITEHQLDGSDGYHLGKLDWEGQLPRTGTGGTSVITGSRLTEIEFRDLNMLTSRDLDQLTDRRHEVLEHLSATGNPGSATFRDYDPHNMYAFRDIRIGLEDESALGISGYWINPDGSPSPGTETNLVDLQGNLELRLNLVPGSGLAQTKAAGLYMQRPTSVFAGSENLAHIVSGSGNAHPDDIPESGPGHTHHVISQDYSRVYLPPISTGLAKSVGELMTTDIRGGFRFGAEYQSLMDVNAESGSVWFGAGEDIRAGESVVRIRALMRNEGTDTAPNYVLRHPTQNTLDLQLRQGQSGDVFSVRAFDNTPLIRILSNGTLESGYPAYRPNTSGWQITNMGNAEFNDVWVRGSLHASVFTADEINASNGSIFVTTATTLSTNLTIGPAITAHFKVQPNIPADPKQLDIKTRDPRNSIANQLHGLNVRTAGRTAVDAKDTVVTLYADVSEETGFTYLKVGDVVRMKTLSFEGEGIQLNDVWIEITSNNADDYDEHIEGHMHMGIVRKGWMGIIPAGTAIVNYGPKAGGQGQIMITADLNYAPYIETQIVNSNPWENVEGPATVTTRLGNLAGIFGATYGPGSDGNDPLGPDGPGGIGPQPEWGLAMGGNIGKWGEPYAVISNKRFDLVGPDLSFARWETRTTPGGGTQIVKIETTHIGSSGDVTFSTNRSDASAQQLKFNASDGTFLLGRESGEHVKWDGKGSLEVTGTINIKAITGDIPQANVTDLTTDLDSAKQAGDNAQKAADDAQKTADDANATANAAVSTTTFTDWKQNQLNWDAINNDPAGNMFKSASPTGSGLFMTGNELGFYENSEWRTYMHKNGNFLFRGAVGEGQVWWNAKDHILAGGIRGGVNAWATDAGSGSILAGGTKNGMTIGRYGINFASETAEIEGPDVQRLPRAADAVEAYRVASMKRIAWLVGDDVLASEGKAEDVSAVIGSFRGRRIEDNTNVNAIEVIANNTTNYDSWIVLRAINNAGSPTSYLSLTSSVLGSSSLGGNSVAIRGLDGGVHLDAKAGAITARAEKRIELGAWERIELNAGTEGIFKSDGDMRFRVGKSSSEMNIVVGSDNTTETDLSKLTAEHALFQMHADRIHYTVGPDPRNNQRAYWSIDSRYIEFGINEWEKHGERLVLRPGTSNATLRLTPGYIHLGAAGSILPINFNGPVTGSVGAHFDTGVVTSFVHAFSRTYPVATPPGEGFALYAGDDGNMWGKHGTTWKPLAWAGAGGGGGVEATGNYRAGRNNDNFSLSPVMYTIKNDPEFGYIRFTGVTNRPPSEGDPPASGLVFYTRNGAGGTTAVLANTISFLRFGVVGNTIRAYVTEKMGGGTEVNFKWEVVYL